MDEINADDLMALKQLSSAIYKITKSMNELILKQIDGDKFLLDGFDKVQGRDLMKFNIFLARYKENINRTNNTISVSFGNCDVFYIAKNIKCYI